MTPRQKTQKTETGSLSNASASVSRRPTHYRLVFFGFILLGVALVYWYRGDISSFFWGDTKPSQMLEATPSLEDRIAALEVKEKTDGALKGDIESRVTKLEDAFTSIEEDSGTSANIEARLKRLEGATASFKDTLSKHESALNPKTAEFNTAVAALAFPLFSSLPYEGELQRVRISANTLSLNDRAAVMPLVQTLDASARVGVANLLVLHQAFQDAAIEALKEQGLPENAGWWDRTLAKIKSLVVIRRIDGHEASALEGVVQKVDVALAAGRVDEAIQHLSELPEYQRPAFEAWLTKAKMREQALNAFHGLVDILAKNVNADTNP